MDNPGSAKTNFSEKSENYSVSKQDKKSTDVDSNTGSLSLEERESRYDAAAVKRLKDLKRHRAAGLEIDQDDEDDVFSNRQIYKSEIFFHAEAKAQVQHAQREAALNTRRRLERNEQNDITASKEDFGVEIIPFNMKNEMAEGNIDADGYYIAHKKSKSRFNDEWLNSVDSQEKSSFVTDDTIKAKVEETFRELAKPPKRVDVVDLLWRIYCYLEVCETPSKALQRFARASDFKSDKKGFLTETRQKFDQITECCGSLLSAFTNVFNETKEQIYDHWQKEHSRQTCLGDKTYWNMRRASNPSLIEGPYSTTYLLAWHRQKQLADDVQILRVNKNGEAINPEAWQSSVSDALLSLVSPETAVQTMDTDEKNDNDNDDNDDDDDDDDDDNEEGDDSFRLNKKTTKEDKIMKLFEKKKKK